MKLNKLQLQAITSKVLTRINEERKQKIEAIKNSEEFKAKVDEALAFLNSLSERQLDLVKNAVNTRSIGISPNSIQHIILKDYNVPRLIDRYGNDFISLQDEIALSTITGDNVDEMIETLVSKFS